MLGYTPKYIDSKFDDIVEFSELQEFLDVPLKNYSSGMVARLAFAVATITKPDILIATRSCPSVTSCFRRSVRSAWPSCCPAARRSF